MWFRGSVYLLIAQSKAICKHDGFINSYISIFIYFPPYPWNIQPIYVVLQNVCVIHTPKCQFQIWLFREDKRNNMSLFWFLQTRSKFKLSCFLFTKVSGQKFPGHNDNVTIFYVPNVPCWQTSMVIMSALFMFGYSLTGIRLQTFSRDSDRSSQTAAFQWADQT